MPEITTTDGLMVWVMNRFAEVFGPRAVLRGGMILRLLDCPRHTNDLDYVLVPYRSKKDVAEELLGVLSELQGADISWSMHSQCLRYLIDYNGIKTQVEVGVAMECKTEELSTMRLSRANNQQGRIVRVMSLDVALAHKLAAWNERRLMRDLYDAYFMHTIMDVKADWGTLQQRLARINRPAHARGPANDRQMSLGKFLSALSQAAGDLDQEHVAAELRDFLAEDDLAGLAVKMKIGLKYMVDAMRADTRE